ncbi:hypothetical protein BJX68DRAFT_133047 [Aspergillus pseudodeflectus]|uniref:Uncharacterized protein n=1 Tax=Aspergillus pseudodeflectus TaxID=176178 RepID=A0ABR4JZT1_9EURO
MGLVQAQAKWMETCLGIADAKRGRPPESGGGEESRLGSARRRCRLFDFRLSAAVRGLLLLLLLLLLHGEIEGRTRTRSEKDGDEDTISHPGAIGRMRGRKGLNKSSDVPLRRVDCDLRW